LYLYWFSQVFSRISSHEPPILFPSGERGFPTLHESNHSLRHISPRIEIEAMALHKIMRITK
jgi:hypothetical protein